VVLQKAGNTFARGGLAMVPWRGSGWLRLLSLQTSWACRVATGIAQERF